jgi:hypothetical protein
VVIPIIDGTYQFYARQTVADHREGVDKEWWVDIEVELSPATGKAEWTFWTLDPETGDLPEDVFAGFLPPNDETGRGEGHVAFAIQPREDAPHGTIVSNQASIVFDTNEPIATNAVTNTIGIEGCYDLDFDGDVDVGDIMLVASRWRCKCGAPCYDPLYDLDRDCDIDVVDIMKVAARWGESCE